MGKTWWIPLIIASLMLLGCSEPSPAARGGTYISEPGFVVMLQIELGEGGRMEGTISGVELASDGDISAYRRPVKGTIEGKAVNFSIIFPPGNRPSTIPVSGVVTDQGMELTFFTESKVTSLSFRAGKAEDFYALVQAVQEKSVELTSKQ